MGSVIVAHPGQQHSYRLASALKHCGLLEEYVTTVYYRSQLSVLGVMSMIAPGNNGERIRSRQNPDLSDEDVKTYYSVRGILETLLWRTRNPQRYRSFMARTVELFGAKVAEEAIGRNAQAVVCYDVNALECFRELSAKKPSVIKILDVSIAPRPYLREIYEQQALRLGSKCLIEENPLVWDKSEDEKRIEEILLADYCLVASDFVANGLISLGKNPESIVKLPYGCNLNLASMPFERERGGQSGFNLLFVGQCNARKGVDVLADLMERPELDGVNLTLVGKYDESRSYIKKLLANPRVRMVGLVSRKEVERFYAEADAFIFPSVAEGMSLACIEAMGSGLPIICTPNSGVTDLVSEGETGYLVSPGDIDALVGRIKVLSNDLTGCRTMGKNAFEIAKAYTWARYEMSVKKEFENRILKGGK